MQKEKHLPKGTTAHSEDLLRMQRENLVSFIVLGTGDPSIDVASAAEIETFAAENFIYFELLILSSSPTVEWRNEFRIFGSKTRSTRVIAIDTIMTYEELASTAMDHAIGDYIISVHPGEITITDLQKIVEYLGSGYCDLVKTAHNSSETGFIERFFATVTSWLAKVLTGKRIQWYQARAYGLSRTAASRITALHGTGKLFRILDLSGFLQQKTIMIETPLQRQLFGQVGEKIRLAFELLSLSAARLIRILALICLSLALLCVFVMFTSILIWVFKTYIAQGWTSLVVILSLLFAANFGVLAAACLGLHQLLRSNEPDFIRTVTTELSGGELYPQDCQLNVETSETTSQ